MRGMLAARRSQIAIVHLLLNRGDRRSGKKRGDRRREKKQVKREESDMGKSLGKTQ